VEVTDPALDEAVVAYLMNGEPLPMLNGFPVSAGRAGKVWRVLDQAPHLDPRAHAGGRELLEWRRPTAFPTRPGDTPPRRSGRRTLKTVPIGHVRLPVAVLYRGADGSSKLPPGCGAGPGHRL